MYCQFYGFREKPFSITPNPRFIFLSKNHREAFAHLLYGIDNHAGFIELTGDVGTGKTTVLRTLLEQLDERGHRTALIFNPCLSALELMRSINREFGIAWAGLDSFQLMEALNSFLLEENRAGRTVVLVIDEAQNLETQVLEQVRLISNLETKTDKLIQIVLAGQPELAQLLNRPELRQIAQRITVSYHLAPLDFEDAKTYIEHRLEVAGDWRAASFTPQALKLVFRHSGGVPRLINITCDRSLLFGYVEETREISARMVKAAIHEIGREAGKGSLVRQPRVWFALAVIIAVAGFLAAQRGFFGVAEKMDGETAGAQTAPAVVPIAGKAAVSAPSGTASTTGTTAAVIAALLRDAGEAESERLAFNAMAKLWDFPPVNPNPRLKLREAAARQGLNLTRYSGSIGRLVRLGYPAILEFTLPGVEGKRYLALTGIAGRGFIIAPPIGGRSSLSTVDLDTLWSGIAYVPWRNFYDIPSPLEPGMKGEKAARLQRLLKDIGLLDGGQQGVFDGATAAAVKKFQTAYGVSSDGKVEEETLLLLYRARGKAIPALVKQEGNPNA